MKAAVGYLAVSPDRDGIFLAVGASRRVSWAGYVGGEQVGFQCSSSEPSRNLAAPSAKANCLFGPALLVSHGSQLTLHQAGTVGSRRRH